MTRTKHTTKLKPLSKGRIRTRKIETGLGIAVARSPDLCHIPDMPITAYVLPIRGNLFMARNKAAAEVEPEDYGVDETDTAERASYYEEVDATDEAPESEDGAESAPAGFQTITAGGHRYIVSAPYTAGHVLTEVEAQALNGLRGENIRNNVTAKNKAAIEKGGEILTQDQVSQYDESYAFATRGTRVGVIIDPVSAEQRRIIIGLLKDQAKSKGRKWSSYDKDQVEATVAAAMQKGIGRSQAEAVVAARSAVRPLEVDELVLAEAAD